jgi:hypothetical protein
MNLRCKRQIFLAVFVLFFSLTANTDHVYAQKLRAAYTAFAGTFTILSVGKEAVFYHKAGAATFLGEFTFGELTQQQALNSLQLFAEVAMPELRKFEIDALNFTTSEAKE